MIDNIDKYMFRAIELSINSVKLNGGPFGCVIVSDNKIIAEGSNEVTKSYDPTAHAEIVAIRKAALQIGNYRLINAKMFVTLEPCLMCCGALIHARFDKVIFSTQDKKSGAVISNGNLLEANFVNHYVKFEQGPMQEESSALLKKFFEIRRSTV